MSEEKQIEEMAMTPIDILANDIYQLCPDLAENYCGDTHCVACLANSLYYAGYRMQSVGEWVDKYHGKYANQLYKCSVCGATAHSDDRGHWFLTPYCPNCGAKMGGGAE